MTKARDIASAAPAPSTVSTTELGYLDGVTSAIQTQIDSKIGSASAISPTLIDAKGDLIVGSAADTAARLAVGTNNYVLTADSAATNGVKWAAAAGGGMTSLASGSLPAANVLNLTSISADYKDLRLVIRNAQHASGSGSGMGYRLNGQGAGGEYNPRLNINSEFGVGAGSDSTRIPLTSNDAKKDENITIQINIFDYANTSTNKRWQHSITYMKQGTTTWESNFQIGQYKFDNSAINQIQLYMDSSFSAGTYELIGIK